jgi:hypothetical protein
MSYCGTTHATGYSPFYLLHGKEMDLPGNTHLKARLPTENTDQKLRLENLKSALNLAYKQVAKANKESH